MLTDFYGKLFQRSRYRIITKAASYTVVPGDNGALLTVTAAATITLPAPGAANKGMWIDIVVLADVDVSIASGTADTLVTINAGL
jgi:hypothetical protein